MNTRISHVRRHDIPLFDGQSPAFIFERLSPQRFETIQTNDNKLTFFDGQTVPRLAVLLQKWKILLKINNNIDIYLIRICRMAVDDYLDR